MSEVSIKEIAEEAAKQPKDILDKAKELGFSVRSVSSKLKEGQALMLYEYITSGVLPVGLQSSGEKSKKDSKTSRTNAKGNKKTQDDAMKMDKSHQEITKNSTPSTTQDSIEERQIIDKQVAASSIMPNDKKKFNVISRGSDAEKEIKDATDTQTQETLPTVQDSVVANKPIDSISTVKQETDSIKEPGIPQGIDLSQVKRPRVSSIRVIRKNYDSSETSQKRFIGQAKLRDSTQILDGLKHADVKERTKKKKDKAVVKPQQKHASHIISVERDIDDSGGR